MGLNAVAVWIDDEGGVVAWSVIGPKPGCPVVRAAGAQGRGMERVDTRARRCREAEVQSRFLVRWHWAVRGVDPQRYLRTTIAKGFSAIGLTGVA